MQTFQDCSDKWKLLLIMSVTEGADDEPAQADALPFPDNIAPLTAAFDECLAPAERDMLDFN